METLKIDTERKETVMTYDQTVLECWPNCAAAIVNLQYVRGKNSKNLFSNCLSTLLQ